MKRNILAKDKRYRDRVKHYKQHGIFRNSISKFN